MIIESEDFIEPNTITPEHILWLAVIERAILDYIDPINCKNKLQLSELEYFFFAEKPKPCNLKYICQNVFDYSDAHIIIRNRVKHLKTLGPNAFDRAKRYRV